MGCYLRQSVVERDTVLLKRKSQGKQIYSLILTARTGCIPGAEGLAWELGGDWREVGTGWDDMKQVAGIAMARTGCFWFASVGSRLWCMYTRLV